jgi:hypothetical protein
MRRIFSNFVWALGNLLAGVRMLLPPPVARRSFHFSANQLVIVTLVAASVAVATRYPFGTPAATFSRYGLALIAANFSLNLLLCYLIAKVQRAPHSLAALAIAILAISIPFEMFGPMLRSRQPTPVPTYVAWPAFAIVLVWYVAAITRAIRMIYACGWRRSFLLAVVFVIASSGIDYVIPDELWNKAEAKAVARESVPPINTEKTYYQQSNMVRRQLSEVAQSRPGVGELYFVAFAGTSTQDVFLKEARSAKELFDASFDTLNRSLILVNNRRTAAELPVASVSNLGWVLNGLAKKMDTETDLLFLYLTSHGSAHRLSVYFPDLALNDLSDRNLRDMLDKSGIKWRVVVISACYSGSFIDALKDENTLVITAAAAERTSFGCSDENDWTYFGDAYINIALRQDRSFIDAFDRARTIVAERERAQKLMPSEPQIYVGTAIKGKLRDLEKRLGSAKAR